MTAIEKANQIAGMMGVNAAIKEADRMVRKYASDDFLQWRFWSQVFTALNKKKNEQDR